MKRMASIALLLALVLVAGTLQAQRGGGAFHGDGVPGVNPGFVGPGRPGLGGHGIPRHPGYRNYGNFNTPFLPFWYGDLFGWDEESSYPEEVINTPPPPVVIVRREAPPVTTPQVLPLNPKVIDVPDRASAAPAKPLPPAVFIFTNGERLEARRYMLTQDRLYLTIHREQRTIPLSALDIDATVAANHAHGIDLQFPADRNEIFLGF
jgi:hypothetical protein